MDDLIFTGNDGDMFSKFKQSMMDEFDMMDLGKMTYFLGLEVIQNSDGIFIGQKKYDNEILDRFQMSSCNPVHNPIVLGCHLTKDYEGEQVESANSWLSHVLVCHKARYDVCH